MLALKLVHHVITGKPVPCFEVIIRRPNGDDSGHTLDDMHYGMSIRKSNVIELGSGTCGY
jgi:hypothetical protein